MNISYNWLKDYLNIDLSPEKVGEILTDTGLEVEGIEKYETVPGGLSGLVIGHVKKVEKHPDADKLNITQVDIGAEELSQIVCGAPNVAEGQKVVVATPGNIIHPAEGEPFKIKKAKIRGVESFGMICAEDEIGIGNGHDGIMVLDEAISTGTLAAKYFEVDTDYIFEIGLTPNRADGMSHIGCAKEVAAFLKTHEAFAEEVKEPSVADFAIDKAGSPIEVNVAIPEACPRYAGLVIENIQVAESPKWLKERIESIGIRSINNVVDITNFVLWEMGQALHAFDMDKVGAKVEVKHLTDGTTFKTLDEEERKLSAEDIMICNDKEGMCIGGVFGGIDSGVSNKTTSIFLESAYFHPTYIRKTSTRHGLRTDAAVRYEKGADINMVLPALKRAAMLIKELAGGSIVSDIYDVYPSTYQNAEITMKWSYCWKLIGQVIEEEKVKNILTTLDFEILSNSAESITVKVPTSRPDVTRPADLVEEILRIFGFNNIELPGSFNMSLTYDGTVNKHTVKHQVSEALVANGFYEVQNNSLTNSKHIETIEVKDFVPILNYSSADLDILRPDLLFSNLDTVRFNLNHKNKDLKLFEFGKSYRKSTEGYQEFENLAITLVGKQEVERWNAHHQDVDYYTLKGYVHQMMTKLGVQRYLVEELNDQAYLFGLSYIIKGREDQELVKFGRIEPSVAKAFGVDQPVYYANFNWKVALDVALNQKMKFKGIAKYPATRRDLALLIDKGISFSQIEKIASKVDKKILKAIDLFDVFEGDQLPEGKKSYAVSFVFQDENKTLTDKEVDKVMNQLIDRCQKDLNAQLR